MILFNIFFFIFFFISFFILNFISKKFNLNLVSGCGFMLPIFIFLYILLNITLYESSYIKFFLFLSFFSIIYLLDDIRGLPIYFRLSLQFISGCLCYLIFINFNFTFLDFLLLFSFGLWTIFLVNVLNFYDGKDLNFSFLMLVFFIIQFIFVESSQNLYNIFSLIILFLIVFSFFNLFFDNFFFGDSGCFAIAIILNLILLSYFTSFNSLNFYYFASLFLPITDVLCVLILRIYLKESLITRNFHHLYQQISIKIKGFYYLLPTLIFSIFFIIFHELVFKKFFQDIYLIILLSFIISFTIYIPLSFIFKKYKSLS